MTSASFTWSASTGPVANYTVQVIDETLGVYHDIATTASTSYTHTGLTQDKVYIYRVIANPIKSRIHIGKEEDEPTPVLAPSRPAASGRTAAAASDEHLDRPPTSPRARDRTRARRRERTGA